MYLLAIMFSLTHPVAVSHSAEFSFLYLSAKVKYFARNV